MRAVLVSTVREASPGERYPFNVGMLTDTP